MQDRSPVRRRTRGGPAAAPRARDLHARGRNPGAGGRTASREPSRPPSHDGTVTMWAILIAFAGVVLAVNALVVALCRVAARAGAALEGTRMDARGTEAAGAGASRAIAPADAERV